MTTSTTDTLIPRLRAELDDRLIAPDSPDYETARQIVRGDIDRRPAAIVRPADAAEVARIVSLAGELGLEVAVRSGGHSAAGHSASDGGIVIDLVHLDSLEIDVEGRTAWAGGGLRAGAYTVATGKHGLATGFGDTGSVGIGGITLGGGSGYLTRKYGLTIDSLLAAEIVTANGEIVIADADSHPDLFWAIRGGGGNFGVVTRFKFQLHPVDQIVGGMLVLPAPPQVIAQFIAEADAAPDELSTMASVMVAPPMPFLPPEVHGQTIVLAFMAFDGPAEDAEPVLARFRGLATPLADLVQPMSYAEIFPPDPENYRPIAAVRTMFLDSFDEQDAETILEHLAASDAPMRATQLRVLGGAVSRVPSDATAYAHRERLIMANVAALYQQPEQAAQHEAWAEGLAAALQPEERGAYIGFLTKDTEADVRRAYPDRTWDRLAAVKRRYDPGNLFRLNHNIPPAADAP